MHPCEQVVIDTLGVDVQMQLDDLPRPRSRAHLLLPGLVDHHSLCGNERRPSALLVGERRINNFWLCFIAPLGGPLLVKFRHQVLICSQRWKKASNGCSECHGEVV